MLDNLNEERKDHELILKNRGSLDMNGVVEVISFDDVSVLLKTVCGELYIEGKDLHLSTLDTSNGRVSVNGNIISLLYSEVKQNDRKSRFGRLAK